MKWISVKERLPHEWDDLYNYFLVTDGTIIAMQRWMDNGNGANWNDISIRNDLIKEGIYQQATLGFHTLSHDVDLWLNHTDITHWMALPETPKDKE